MSQSNEDRIMERYDEIIKEMNGGMEYNVIGSVWYNKIGIVWVKTEYDGVKTYIGTGSGLDQKADEQHIAAWGQPFYADYISSLDVMHKEMEK